MMGEHRDQVDGQVRKVWDRAQPPMPDGWQARATAALAAGCRADRGSRTPVIVLWVIVVLVAVGYVPYTATGPQAQMASALAAAGQQAEAEVGREDSEASPLERMLAPYRQRAVEFVKRHHPRDPEMLMAAGLLTQDEAAARKMLGQAAQESQSPAAWAAYSNKLIRTGPSFAREAGIADDPESPDLARQVEEFRRQPHVLDRLTAEEAAPVLEAVRHWQQVDPQNALPLALESRYLYGLHRDAEALARWEEAGSLPEVNWHMGSSLQAVVHLLDRMGMSESEAVAATFGTMLFPTLSGTLSNSARVAHYQGRVAQLEGRSSEAIAWWRATSALGHTMQVSAPTIIDVLVGSAIEGIGGSPSWKWYPDHSTGLSGGPLYKGRIFYGPQHAFYVSMVGEDADAQLRNQLVQSRVRAALMKEFLQWNSANSPYIRAHALVGLAGVCVVTLALLVFVYVAVSVKARRAADEATHLSRGMRLMLGLAVLSPLALGDIAYWWWLGDETGRPVPMLLSLVGGIGFTLVAALAVTRLAVRWSHMPGVGTGAVWRGNLRRVLPVSVLVCALGALLLAFAGRQMRAHWIRDWASPGRGEVAAAKQYLGPRWENPPIPPDAWRAEYPPMAPQEAGPPRDAFGGRRGPGRQRGILRGG